MSRETAEQVIELLRRHDIPTLDITGGAPELNPSFRYMVEQAHWIPLSETMVLSGWSWASRLTRWNSVPMAH